MSSQATKPRAPSTADTTTKVSSSVKSAPFSLSSLTDLFPSTFISNSSTIQSSYKSLLTQLIPNNANNNTPIPVNHYKKVLQYVAEFIESNTLDNKIRESIVGDNNILPLFTALYDVITQAVRTKTVEKQFQADLTKLQFPTAYLTDMISLYTAKRTSFEASAVSVSENLEDLPRFEALQWRVDVTISTNSLARVFRPTILMQLTTSDGKINQFECSVEQFQQFRYQVAKLLKNVHDISEHPTLER